MLRDYVNLVVVALLWINVSVQAATPSATAIASAHPEATQAGMKILQAGGNAFDAAVTVAAVLAVVEPYSSGMGGGGFWLLHSARDGMNKRWHDSLLLQSKPSSE